MVRAVGVAVVALVVAEVVAALGRASGLGAAQRPAGACWGLGPAEGGRGCHVGGGALEGRLWFLAHALSPGQVGAGHCPREESAVTVELAAIEPDAAAGRAIVDLHSGALAHHERDGAMGGRSAAGHVPRRPLRC